MDGGDGPWTAVARKKARAKAQGGGGPGGQGPVGRDGLRPLLGGNRVGGYSWQCPTCGARDNWARREDCRGCGLVPTAKGRLAGEAAELASRQRGLAGSGGAAAAAAKEEPAKKKAKKKATTPAGEVGTSGSAVAEADKPDKAEASGKAQVAGLRSAAAALRALGLDAAAELLEAAAAAKQSELDAEKPLASRFAQPTTC